MDAGNYNGEGAASAAPIPAELRARDQWVCWKYETRDGKPTKVPFTSFGAMASSTDPATWFDFETCSSSANGFDGAGYVFSADDPFTGIDFDSCLEDGKLHPEVAALVATLDSYTEISPSGTGVKVIVRATKNVERCRTGKTEWGGVFEVYDRERYFTITGNALTGTPATIEDRQSQLDEVLRRVFGEPKPPATTHTTPVAGGFQGEEKDLIERACRAKNGARFERLWNGDTSGHNDDDSAADLALVAMLAFWTGCDPERIDSLFRQSGLMRDKWLRDDYRERTITKAITECDDVYRGGEVIDLTEYVASVNGSTIEDVDGAELLDELVSHYRRFMVMTEAQTDVVALFTVMTYCVRAFTVVPYLRVDSPTKRTGKSRLLELLEFTVQAPLKTGGVSEAALFRSLNDGTRCLLFDEIGAVLGEEGGQQNLHSDIAALLLNGFTAGTPVMRCIGQGSHQEVVLFDVYGPKVLGGKGQLNDMITDRCLLITLKRKSKGEQVERWRRRHADQVSKPLRVKMQVWARAHLDELASANPDLPEQLDDRAQDIAESLFAVADVAGGNWPQRARRAVIELRGSDPDADDDIGVALLTDIRKAFDLDPETERLPTETLIHTLCEDPERPWKTWSRGDQMTPRALSGVLRTFGIKSSTIRFSDSLHKGYKREQFEDAWERYLSLPSGGPLSVTSVTTAVSSGLSVTANPPDQANVTGVTEKCPSEGRGEEPVLDEVRELISEGVIEPPSSTWECPCGTEAPRPGAATPTRTINSIRLPECGFCGRKYKPEFRVAGA